MISRISATFATLKSARRTALIPFIMAGDPDLQTTAKLLDALPEAGADIIEIGVPFSDPMADGPVIQLAGQRSLENGTKLKDILALVKAFRAKNDGTPVILMGYYNPFYHYGPERFCADAAAAGMDGVIIVDLPPEEEAEFTPHAHKSGIALIRLLAPTSIEGRLPMLLHHAQGFAYYISVAGITGAKSANMEELSRNLATIRTHTNMPVAVGFGIKTPEQAAEVAKHADAVVVGSALVDIIAKAKTPVQEAVAFVRLIAQSIAAI